MQVCVLGMRWKSGRVANRSRSKIPTAIRSNCSNLLASDFADHDGANGGGARERAPDHNAPVRTCAVPAGLEGLQTTKPGTYVPGYVLSSLRDSDGRGRPAYPA